MNGKWALVLVCAAAVLLVPVVAWAAGGGERVRINPNDQRIARQSLMSMGDLIGPTFLWKQGSSGSSNSSESVTACDAASPRNLSRYVISGDANRKFTPKANSGESLTSEVTVFRTLGMAKADWAATISYKKLSCVSKAIDHAIKGKGKVVSPQPAPAAHRQSHGR